MKPLKQALNLFRSELKLSLLLGFGTFFLIAIASRIPYFGAWIMTFSFLIIQIYIWSWQSQSTLKFPSALIKKNFAAIVLTSLILVPTGMLLGSSAGVLQKTDQFLTSLPLAFFIIYLCLFFYIILSHALLMSLSKNMSVMKAMDECFAKSLKRPHTALLACFYLSVILLVATLPLGFGLILGFPMLFYVTYYSA